MKTMIIAAAAAAALWSGAAVAADIKVLSAGAVKSGLLLAADDFKRASGNVVTVQFDTAPQLAKKLAEGEAADILIAPPALLDAQAKAERISAQGRIMLGRVGAGVVVRADAPSPSVATTEALKRAMLGADSITYNTASTGLYLEKLFERIGIAGEDQGQDHALSQRRCGDGASSGARAMTWASGRSPRSSCSSRKASSSPARCRRRFRTTRATAPRS